MDRNISSNECECWNHRIYSWEGNFRDHLQSGGVGNIFSTSDEALRAFSTHLFLWQVLIVRLRVQNGYSFSPQFMNQAHIGNKIISRISCDFTDSPSEPLIYVRESKLPPELVIMLSQSKETWHLINLCGLIVGKCRLPRRHFEIWKQPLDLNFNLEISLGVWACQSNGTQWRFSYCRWGNWGPERGRDFPKITWWRRPKTKTYGQMLRQDSAIVHIKSEAQYHGWPCAL